ncbi:XRE family transcriptional regulator [Clostridium botulinum]|uniref:XRE family transcriptional regulator n=1 Tax=Clostridium botulinum TaxID=1491 RepID=A0A6M0SQS9_CLOBO|nr:MULTISPECIES: helix-turn-helix transcriptional regulator [Clostridium]MCS6130856.1 XRE family transcriptional regulator [Clostridium botulinum]NFA43650.1 XRE family transcriptional regulator [Clostridium botulinum]NFI54311.1 helix-turn-helix transcriptional regulator [Clostridium botulinum]NFL45756.1 helix-turn-helix transcriptional regulator [Clostridium botulinum]NFL89131.1 helix-turn-helix transcriptional regulator [Clostridium botulinum]
MNVGNNIKKYRKSKKLTQQQLAELVGISQNSVRRYELGQREPNYDMLKRIAQALNISFSDLTKEEPAGTNDILNRKIPFNLGENIQLNREEQNISRKQFANELGVSVEDVIKFETIPKSVSIDMLNKICNILNITNTEWITRSDTGIKAHKESIAIDGFLSICLYLGINIELEPDEDGNLIQANIKYNDIEFNLNEEQYQHLFKEVCKSLTKEVLNSQFYNFLGY